MSSTLAPAPTQGELPWGSWSNGDEKVELSIFLDEGTRPGSAVCEAAEGWLCVFLDNSYEACEPALSASMRLPACQRSQFVRGEPTSCLAADTAPTLAPVYDDETGAWGGEEVVQDEEGPPPLLLGRFAQLVRARDLEYIVRERDGRRELFIELPKALEETATGASCIFDETLTVRGEPCLVPGLSQPVE